MDKEEHKKRLRLLLANKVITYQQKEQEKAENEERRKFLKALGWVAFGLVGGNSIIQNWSEIKSAYKSWLDRVQAKTMEDFVWDKRTIKSEDDFWKYTDESSRRLKEQYTREEISAYIMKKNHIRGAIVHPDQEIEIPVGYKK